jgi:uncharacterized OB-fold protein
MLWSSRRCKGPHCISIDEFPKESHEMSSELTASRCPQCGLLAVPPEPFGCERCGTPAAQLVAASVSSDGVVVGHAVVHQHASSEPATPFVIVEVRLDAGPVLRSLLRGAGPGDVALGDRVAGATDDGRFAFVAATGAGR